MVLGELVGFVNHVAQVLGYGVLFIFGLVAVGHVVSMWWWRTSSWEAKQAGAQLQKEHDIDSGTGAKLVDALLEIDTDIGDDCDLRFEPSPAFNLDWSMSGNADEEYVRRVKSILEAEGFYLHPYPRSPDEWSSDEWHWSKKNAGIWAEPPRFYLEGEDESRDEAVETDLSGWEIES